MEEEKEIELTTYLHVDNHICYEYFVGYEIASLLGYKNTTQVVLNNVSKYHQLIFKEFPGAKTPDLDPRTVLITRDGVVEILLKTRKRLSPDVLHMFKMFHIDPTNRKCLSKEQQTLSPIANLFKDEKFEDQFKVGKYFIDLYFTDYKIAVECDENGHTDRKPWKEEERMRFINEELGIDDSHWIRYNPDEYEFDLTKVQRRILSKMNEIKEQRQKFIKIEDIPIIDDEIKIDFDEEEEIKKLEAINFKNLRKVCKELNIIQLGNKKDMIKRLIDNKKNELITKIEIEKESKIEKKEYIYQYNSKGCLVKKYESILEASKSTKIETTKIEECINLNVFKAGEFIFRKEETFFSKDELAKLNRKNSVIIIKMDIDFVEVKRYNSIKETVEDNPNLSRNILDRITRNSEVRDGFIYKCMNEDNKIKHLSQKQKEEIVEKRKNGKSVYELAIEYGKCEKHIRNIIVDSKKLLKVI